MAMQSLCCDTGKLLKTIQKSVFKVQCSTCSNCFERNAKKISAVSSTRFYGGKRYPATISHPYFKLKPILKEKRDALKQELIDTADKLSSNVLEGFKCNKSSDILFHWSDNMKKLHKHRKI